MGGKGRAALGARSQLTARLCGGRWQGGGREVGSVWAETAGPSCAHGNQGHRCKKGLQEGEWVPQPGLP